MSGKQAIVNRPTGGTLTCLAAGRSAAPLPLRGSCMASSASFAALLPTLRWDADPSGHVEESILQQARALDRFLGEIEKRAFRIARIALRHDDDALDVVQDAMLQLARRYGKRPSDEWRPLFYRILQNRIRDCQRRRKGRSRIMAWLPGSRSQDEAQIDPFEAVPDTAPTPVERLATDQAMHLLERALAALPGRQQQAFMLRNFESMDVAQTAAAMGCSEGSVKTHYSRAVHTLRDELGAAW
jgi:RNA polymerase sigma-70 factor (ECF subfamily)